MGGNTALSWHSPFVSFMYVGLYLVGGSGGFEASSDHAALWLWDPPESPCGWMLHAASIPGSTGWWVPSQAGWAAALDHGNGSWRCLAGRLEWLLQRGQQAPPTGTAPYGQFHCSVHEAALWPLCAWSCFLWLCRNTCPRRRAARTVIAVPALSSALVLQCGAKKREIPGMYH